MGNKPVTACQGAETGGVVAGGVADAAAPWELPSSLTDARARSIRSVLFLDIDGILNIGLQDPEGEAPLLLNEANAEVVREAQGLQPWQMSEASRIMIESLASVLERKGEFVVNASSQCHDELVRRLATILEAAGEDTAVVLASTWRKACNADKVLRLQEDISRHLGRPFAFAAKTADRPETAAADRLEAIADFLVQLSGQRDGATQPLQALLLEDFFARGMDGWWCGGVRMHAAADAEAYIIGRVGAWASSPVQAKLLHCYEEWSTPSGVEVRVGGGLTPELVDEGAAFLRRELEAAEAPQSAMPMGLFKRSFVEKALQGALCKPLVDSELYSSAASVSTTASSRSVSQKASPRRRLAVETEEYICKQGQQGSKTDPAAAPASAGPPRAPTGLKRATSLAAAPPRTVLAAPTPQRASLGGISRASSPGRAVLGAPTPQRASLGGMAVLAAPALQRASSQGRAVLVAPAPQRASLGSRAVLVAPAPQRTSLGSRAVFAAPVPQRASLGSISRASSHGPLPQQAPVVSRAALAAPFPQRASLGGPPPRCQALPAPPTVTRWTSCASAGGK